MRPFIHINCAMSADGKIAGSERKQVRISSQEDKDRVKSLRRTYDAILVGVGTIVSDDPHLTVKGRTYEENQVRIVIDPKCRIPLDALVLDDRARTVIAVEDGKGKDIPGATIVECGSPFDLDTLMERLSQMGIGSILVEGGGETIASFFRNGLVDRYTVFVGSKIIGGRMSPTPADGDGWVMEEGFPLRLVGAEILGDGVLLSYEKE
ncbi:MAG: 2,5-diamino-6-(ribosylamino)-4(3H)-pyrimidinone 5'-phosphate reductase [Candidatus Methanomethylophilaceae archaeon]|nr:2,5-diamino-6-(ribosylamino)-4(3H)-pyrimidinone 5'-phosphate reductase [Candidatus Methanomethylophilaceae archaeon]MBO5669113.1 2,5-diamino-6-(ribosylamino)-4(3H)-pyrimidinone 5'-phosphate reductase [Candidatus Methanomethylophilaceae archaeon]MBO7205722.1 2,5-diamino-6-(ribosylamino)-4(3H)-pyrimidinone 5'-phosphate reductase [Candidatus Methanomethylophilaceae archaeon]